MSKFAPMIARHQLLVFLLVTFAVSWIDVWLWLAGAAERPSLNPFGPVVGALTVVGLSGGWSGLRAFVARVGRVRGIAASTWALATLLPIAIFVASAALAQGLGTPSRLAEVVRAWPELLVSCAMMFFIVGIGEEPGWRGYLQTHLQGRLSPLKAGLAMAVIWPLWHIPMEIGLRADTVIFLALNQFFLCFFLIWLTNRARGGVLPAMLAHMVINALGVGFVSPKGEYWWIIDIPLAGFALLGLTVLIWTRGRLGYQHVADEAGPVGAPVAVG